VEQIAERVRENPAEFHEIHALREAIDLLGMLPFSVTVWSVQNVCYELLQKVYPNMVEAVRDGNESAELWVRDFRDIASRLSLKVE
jgi:hypothetical protein